MNVTSEVEKKVKYIVGQVDPDRYLDTLENLIRIPCLSGEEGEFARWVAARLNKIGWKDVIVDEFNSVIGHLPGNPRQLLISNHMDAVLNPAMENPFTPRIEELEGERRVYGSGVACAKASIASILEALEALVASSQEIPTITFLGVGRNFHPSIHGIRDAFKHHRFEADGAIVGEPTDLRMGIGARGYAYIDVSFKGKAHHAGVPDNRRNPIAGTAAFLHKAFGDELPEDPLLGKASLTALQIDSEGQRPHTPSSARVLVDRRLVLEDPPVEAIVEQYRDWAMVSPDRLQVEVALKRHQFPWLADSDHPVVVSLSESLRIVTGEEPVRYAVPFSSSAGVVKNIGNITPVAFGGADVANLGPKEHVVLSKALIAAKAWAGAIALFVTT